MSAEIPEDNPEVILAKYKSMKAECQQMSAKINELTVEKDEHRLVTDTLSKLNGYLIENSANIF